MLVIFQTAKVDKKDYIYGYMNGLLKLDQNFHGLKTLIISLHIFVAARRILSNNISTVSR